MFPLPFSPYQAFDVFPSANCRCNQQQNIIQRCNAIRAAAQRLGDTPMPHITTQPWQTSTKGTSQQLCLWRMFCVVVPFAETSSGAWRSPASLLQERINHTDFLQHKRSHPSKVTSSAPDGYNHEHSGLVCFWPGR